MKKLSRVMGVLLVVIISVFVLFRNGVVYADSGTGSGGTAGNSGCNTANYATTNVCSDNGKKTGGASWHVFKTMDPDQVYTKYGLYKDSNGPKYCRTTAGYSSDNCSRWRFISDSGYDRKLATTCPKSKYNYYLAYVYDGWNGRDGKGNKKNIPTYYGPIGWNVKLSGNKVEYNSTGAMSWETLERKLRKDESISDGQKITAAAAKELCKADDGDGPCGSITSASIPNKTGYICVNYPHDVTLTAYARDVNGQALNGGNIIDSQTISVPPKGSGQASVNKMNIEGYTFKGWRETDAISGDYVSTSNTFTKEISANTNVYAYYEKISEITLEFSAQSTLSMRVANDKVNKYNNLQEGVVYAKPGDGLTFETGYHSEAQSGLNQVANKIIVNGGAQNPSNSNTTATLQQLFNDYPGDYGQWSNGFTVVSEGFASQYKNTHVLEVGKNVDETDRNNHTVANNEIGVLKEVATTLKNEAGVGTTPYKVEVVAEGGLKVGKISTGLKTEASAYVPYNFTIGASIGDDPDSPDNPDGTNPDSSNPSGSEGDNGGSDEQGVVYAGESETVRVNVKVGERTNSLTTNSADETYSTRADDLSQHLIVYNPDVVGKKNGGVMVGDRNASTCAYFGANEDGVNCTRTNSEQLNLQSGEKREKQSSYVVPDVSAGSKICVAVAVFPADSGAEDNIKTENYNNVWRISDSKCYVVAKRPSIQVLGGNVYSGGVINTGLSIKKHLAGYTNYSATMNNDPYVFGSWGELGVMSSSRVTGFASGATLGKSADAALPGGYHGKYSFCKLSVLSFANDQDQCNNNFTGNIGTSYALNGIKSDKSNIKGFVNTSGNSSNKVEYGDGETVVIGNANYYHSSGKLNVGATTISKNTIKVIRAGGDITISGDINYENTEYENFAQTPKLVIYSDESIIIACGVGKVNALLLASTVKTCDSDDINAAANSNQLSIYGAVIANKLVANRTYGAATGVNSKESAEIIEFDPTLYLWGEIDDGVDENDGDDADYLIRGDLEMVYVHDIAPRY